MTAVLDRWLPTLDGRCAHGYHRTQGCPSCTPVAPTSKITAAEWATFVAALEASVRPDGTVHQTDMRPRIRGRIEPPHIASCYRRAKDQGLIADTGEREQSDDVIGRNGDKLDRIYAWLGKRAAVAA